MVVMVGLKESGHGNGPERRGYYDSPGWSVQQNILLLFHPPPRGRPTANRSTILIIGAAPNDNHGHSAATSSSVLRACSMISCQTGLASQVRTVPRLSGN